MEHTKQKEEPVQTSTDVSKEQKEKKSHDPWLKSSFSLQEKRQLELIRKYFPVDEKNRLVTVRLFYEKAGDLFEENIGKVESPFLKPDLFNKLQEIISEMPIGYRVDVHLRIDNYEDYTPKEIADNISDTMELNHFRNEKSKRRKWVTSAFLIIVGILILFLMGYGSANEWFGEGENASLITEVLDIAAWVFIWEAVTILLVEPSENFVSRIGYIGRINSFSFYQGNNAEPLYREDFRSDYRKKFENSTRVKKFISALFLIAGGLEVIIGFNMIFVSSIHFFQQGQTEITAYAYVASLISALFQILAGISASECYLNQGKLRKLSPIFATFALVMVIILLVNGLFVSRTGQFWVNNWFALAINIIYIIGYLIYRNNHPRN